MLRLLTEYRHKRFFFPRCTVPGVRCRNSLELSCAASFTFDRPPAAVLGVQLCSRPTPTQHAVACRQMLTQELLAEAAVIATQALSAGPAFHSRSAAVALVVRRQHLIVPQTKAVTVVEHRHQQTRTKIGTNPSLCVRMQAPHFCPGAPQPPNSAIPKYTQTPHFSLKILPNPSLFTENASKPLTFVLPPAPPPSPPIPRVSPSSIPNDPHPQPRPPPPPDPALPNQTRQSRLPAQSKRLRRQPTTSFFPFFQQLNLRLGCCFVRFILAHGCCSTAFIAASAVQLLMFRISRLHALLSARRYKKTYGEWG